MDFFQWFLIICAVIGAIALIASLASKGGGDEEDTSARADAAIDELSDLSRDVFSTFDAKYQELLYLYNLIDEKQAQRKAPDITVGDDTPVRGIPTGRNRVYKNERFERVLQYNAQGLGAEAIAKRLGIGKGEVSLILELNKRA